MEELKEVLHKIDKQLKGFQAASVQYVLDQFYKKNRNKVLIADEVGLGKTIIAKGVIAKSIEHVALPFFKQRINIII
jgi:RecG-like helicase